MDGDDIGVTNHVQATGGTANGSYTNNFADLFVINGVATITNTYKNGGGATNKPSRWSPLQTPSGLEQSSMRIVTGAVAGRQTGKEHINPRSQPDSLRRLRPFFRGS